jgi:DUF4097 and DUF4098 domain-containing protein YvlB
VRVTAERPRISIASRSGRVHVSSAPHGDVAVRGGTFTTDDGTVRVDGGASSRVEVTCPEGSDVVVAAMSGRVVLDGVFGDVRVTTSSGRVEIGRAASVDARSASGAIAVAECSGECRCVSKSGRIEVGGAATLVADTTSGRVVADRVRGADVHTGTGRVRVVTAATGPVTVRTVSGAVEVVVPAGSAPRARLVSTSGRISSDCPTGDGPAVDVETVSGRIELRCR